MKNYTELYKLISSEIESTSYGQSPAELYEPISYMMALGGKRLRPVLVLMACQLFDSNVSNAINAAHAIEVFHNFTLVHDDIMDNAPLRRGQQTVYTKWNMPIAILSGDLMMIKATQLLCETETNELKALLDMFNKTAIEVCEGQQIDMNFEARNDVTHEEYIQMISLKTSVLLAASLHIGAKIGGASNEDAQYIYDFGKNIGIAFQIQDDILDSFGEGVKVGKKIGGDIASNKKTLLLIELLSACHKDDKALLEKLINETNEEAKIMGVLELYKKYQVKEFAEAEKSKYINLAFQSLDKVKSNVEAKKLLSDTANELMTRMS
jgi:geranylgeranyl diphosphate synthase, type II